MPSASRSLVGCCTSHANSPEDGPDLILQANGRYAHKRSHIEAAHKRSLETTVEELIFAPRGGTACIGFTGDGIQA